MALMNGEPSATNSYSFPGTGRAEAILGTSQIYKLESSRTGGRLVCLEITVPPGQGVPPHRHRDEDETFYVITGRLVVEGDDIGDVPVRLDAGSLFHGPRGRLHSFRCEGPETAKILVFVSPGANIEAMFGRLVELARQYGGAADFARVAAIAGEHGIAMTTPAQPA